MEVDLIFKIAAIGILVAVLNQLLIRSGREEQGLMVVLAGLVAVLMMMVQQISALFDLIKRLFELEVPEVYDGVVEVRSVAREPGVRSKVAVSSYDDRLDPVGACVGPKGSRVRTVVSELRGERVDVVLWSDDPARCVANALSPAKVSRVLVDEENNYATVIVPDDQLSLAIGKEGQNARLAARLTGWHIDIKSASFNVDTQDEDNLLIDEVEEDDGICVYATPDGIRCRNHARPGSRYCGIHADEE
jgi:N utilization substance protein A